MEMHTLELSNAFNSSSELKNHKHEDDSNVSMLELALLCGAMVHSKSTFSINSDGTSLKVEWSQQYSL
jgi:hypothetical protein